MQPKGQSEGKSSVADFVRQQQARLASRLYGGMLLFGIIFLMTGIGIFSALAVPGLLNGIAARGWVSTDAELLEARVHVSGGHKDSLYQAQARYRYRVDGRLYENDRVSIHGINDNIGDFQQQLGQALAEAFAQKHRVQVWYDPANPAKSVLNREMRWDLLAFESMFLLLFGGFGLGAILLARRVHRASLTAAAWEYPAGGLTGGRMSNRLSEGPVSPRPWLTNTAWQGPRIESSLRNRLRRSWLLAIFVSTPSLLFLAMSFKLWTEEGLKPLMFEVPFVVVALILLALAIRDSLDWRRFGPGHLVMDPFPGAIGGDLGGTIELGLGYNPALRPELTLSCQKLALGRRTTGEALIWQAKGCAKMQPGAAGCRFGFRFNLPQGLPQASPRKTHGAIIWRLEFRLKGPGISLKREFELPVFATGASSRQPLPLASELCPDIARSQGIQSLIRK